MICPYCEQGVVLSVRVKVNNMIVYICEECDTVWMNKEITIYNGMNLDRFSERINYALSWEDFELLDM